MEESINDVGIDNKILGADDLLHAWLVQEQNIFMEELRLLEIRKVKRLDYMPAMIHVIVGLKIIIVRLKSRLQIAGFNPDDMIKKLSRSNLDNVYKTIDVINSFIEKSFNKEVLL